MRTPVDQLHELADRNADEQPALAAKLRQIASALAAPPQMPTSSALRAVFTNDVIRAIGALARQQEVCREQDGKTVFVTGMDAAREYLIERVREATPDPQTAIREQVMALKSSRPFDPTTSSYAQGYEDAKADVLQALCPETPQGETT